VNGTPRTQYMWSPANDVVWVDAMIFRDRDSDSDGSLDERIYVQQDANYNVTPLIGITGVVLERFVYDSYGSPTTLNPDWSLDADGTDYVWAYLHQGGRHDATLKLSHFRNRDLHVELGRWTRQDPLGFVDGSNTYQGYVGNPVNGVDPTGEFWWVVVAGVVGGVVGGIGSVAGGGGFWEGAVPGAVGAAVGAATFNPAAGAAAAAGLGTVGSGIVGGAASGALGGAAGALADGVFGDGVSASDVLAGGAYGALGGAVSGPSGEMIRRTKLLNYRISWFEDILDAVYGASSGAVQGAANTAREEMD